MIDLKRRVTQALRPRLDAAIAAIAAVRQHPGNAARGAAAFVLRWSIRIAFPVLGAAAMLTLFPYHATAGGVHFRIEGSLLTHRTLSADTTFGSWVFSDVDGLPVGIHITPVNVDLVRMASAVSSDPQRYPEQLRADLVRQLPAITAWIVAETLIGVLAGLAAAAGLNLAVRQLRGLPRREREIRLRLQQLAVAGGVIVLVADRGRNHLRAGLGAALAGDRHARRSAVVPEPTAELLHPTLQSTRRSQCRGRDPVRPAAAHRADQRVAGGVQHHVHLRHAPRQHLPARRAVRHQLRRQADHQHR